MALDDGIREKRKIEILEEAFLLVGKTWVDPYGVKHPYLSKGGALLCPLALSLEGREVAATDLHELVQWPWKTMSRKYTPEKLNARSTIDAYTAQARVSAYYVKPLLALISREMNCSVADGPEARAILGHYVQCKYGTKAYAEAIINLSGLMKSLLSIQVEEIKCEAPLF